ncbi:MAG TPA: DUF3592 domain-containing protein [Ktedonobacteraceae bacterium]|jgi:hypothetical protein|nr:DUF3592 domain-containing protein [Ktedonobacteraceae bacterium]
MRQPGIFIFGTVGGIFLLVGLPFMLISYFSYTSTTNFMQKAISTHGTIVRCNWTTTTTTTTDSSGTHSSTSTTCQPIVRFQTQQGQQIEFIPNFSSSSMNQGDEIQVSYQVDNPHDARISSFAALWLFPLIFGGLGGLLTLIALVFLIFIIRTALASRTSFSSPYMASLYSTNSFYSTTSSFSTDSTDLTDSSFSTDSTDLTDSSYSSPYSGE